MAHLMAEKGWLFQRTRIYPTRPKGLLSLGKGVRRETVAAFVKDVFD